MSAEPKPPPPLEWHPAYRDKTWLLDWVEERGDHARLAKIEVPFLRMPVAIAEPTDRMGDLSVHTLTRRRAFGPAPYVGRPFIYAWRVGIDELGRCIAGDSWREYQA